MPLKFLLIFLLSSAVTPAKINPRSAEKVVSEEKLRYEVSFLADSLCAGRSTGSWGGTLAGLWISHRFKDIGLRKFDDSWFRNFVYRGYKGSNVIGFLPGKNTGRYIVVGAHYDGMGKIGEVMYPGADSNASGVAALLSLAEMFARLKMLGKDYPGGIIFVAFDGKYLNMSGSTDLARMIGHGDLVDPVTGETITADKVHYMVNIDQVGGTYSPLTPGRKDYLMMLSDEDKGRRNALTAANNQYFLGLDINFTYYGSRDFTRLFYSRISDQRPFLEKGITSVMFTSGITMLNNKPGDDASSIDYEILHKRILLMYHYIIRLL